MDYDLVNTKIGGKHDEMMVITTTKEALYIYVFICLPQGYDAAVIISTTK